MTNNQFIKSISKGAQDGWREYSILPSLTIAQGILESGWGKTGLTTNANNLFGIKASKGWKGEVYTVKTREQKKDGTDYYVVADFRKYKNWDESCVDHGVFLNTKRYEKVRGEKNYKLACQYIREAGYATDLNYTKLLIQLIEQYKLYEYDKIVYKIPNKTVKSTSPYNDIAWLQIKLNEVNNAGLVVDGIKGKNTTNAVINYWKSLGWNVAEEGNAGAKTILALSENRKK